MPVKGLSQEEIDAATAAVVASGGKSTDRANRLPGETATEANARITAAYKELVAKPILSQEQKDAGMTVQFVRTGAGGSGEYVPIKPAGYTGPTKVTQFTEGIIPANSKYTTGTNTAAGGNTVTGTGTSAGTGTGTGVGAGTTQYDVPGSVIGSSIAKWATDPATGKERTPEEIIAAVTKAVLEDKVNNYGTSLDPLTGKPRPVTDAQKVQIALAQLAANAKFESSRLLSAQKVSQFLSSGGVATALANRPDLWTLGKDTVGTIIDRQNFDDPRSVKRFVVDPTKNQLTPDQLRQYNEIGAAGGMAIDPITGFQVLIDSQGKYTLGQQPEGDATGINYVTGNTGFTGNIVGRGNLNTLTAGDGTKFTDKDTYLKYQAMLDQNADALDIKKRESQSAYSLLLSEFQRYGMGSLVEPLKQFIQEGLSSSEFTLRLRESDAYKKRFAANASRIAKGLGALNEAEYIGLEDQYQNIMRQYGLPASYYTRGDMGRQEGFEKFLSNDVSAAELEDRIMTAQSRVTNANPEVLATLKQFYPGIADGDILAYTLDPDKALTDIKRKVTAAEIGGAAMQRGLGTTMARAEELGAAGITKQQAQQGFGAIAGGLTRGSQLASIYGEDPYTQTTAESEVFNVAGSTEAEKQRKKLTSLEKATFGGQSGASSGALVRDRAGAY